jgi:hypothetical protein
MPIVYIRRLRVEAETGESGGDQGVKEVAEGGE